MKILFILCTLIYLAIPALAHDGHDHGDSAFVGNQVSTSFDLTDIQIHNLQLKEEEVKKHTLYKTITIPMTLRHAPLTEQLIAQGFIMEGKELFIIEKGMNTIIKLDVSPDKTLSGKVYEIDEEIDTTNRMFSIYSNFNTSPPFSFVGLKGEMTILLDEEENALAVSQKAVQGEAGNFYVFIRKENHFERRPVAIGHVSGDLIEIIHGLSEGEKVITQGAHQLQFVTTSTNRQTQKEEIE